MQLKIPAQGANKSSPASYEIQNCESRPRFCTNISFVIAFVVDVVAGDEHFQNVPFATVATQICETFNFD
jgi:hypothetical protein